MGLNVGEVGRFDDASLIETERFPDGMSVLVVDIKTDDFVLSPAVEQEAVEVVARVVADADGVSVSVCPTCWTVVVPSDSRVLSFPEAVNLLCSSEKRLSVSVYPSARLKLNTSYTQAPSEVGRYNSTDLAVFRSP